MRRVLVLVVVLVLAAVALGIVLSGGDGDEREAPPAASGSEAAERRPPGDVFVSPKGEEDGDGSRDDPFGTLGRAFEALQPGDTLHVDGGAYEERLVDLDIRPGTEDAPIHVRAAEGERPVLRGLLWLEEPSHWTIEGLNVTWDDDSDDDEHMVKISGGTSWTYADAELWGARSYAALLVAGDPEDFALRRLHVHDTKETNGENQDHLVYLNAGTGGGVVEGCLLVGSPNGRAIKVGPADDDGDAVGGIVIRYNTMVRNLGPSNVQLAYDTSDVRIERNVMVSAGKGRHSVTAFHLDGDGNVVADNVVFDSAGAVQDVDGLEDGGGNRRLDPELQGDGQVPGNRAAAGYGHSALPASGD